VEVTIGVRKPPLPPDRLRQLIADAVTAAAAVRRRRAPRLSVAVVGDRLMRRLNREFHATDRTTDVLAFPLDSSLDGTLDDDPTPAPDPIVGEIIVCAAQARREAGYRGLRPEVELILYVVHGTLHLLGEDDATPEEALRMRRLEMSAMRSIGLPLPESHLQELK